MLINLQPLDYEEQKNYKYTVFAMDNTTSPRVAYAIVIISVSDIDDNIPLFTDNLYAASFHHSVEVGTSVMQVTVSIKI